MHSLQMSVSDMALQVSGQRKISEGVSVAMETDGQKSTFQEQNQCVNKELPQLPGLRAFTMAAQQDFFFLFSLTQNCCVSYILSYFEWDILSCPHLTIGCRLFVQEWTDNLIFSS